MDFEVLDLDEEFDAKAAFLPDHFQFVGLLANRVDESEQMRVLRRRTSIVGRDHRLHLA